MMRKLRAIGGRVLGKRFVLRGKRRQVVIAGSTRLEAGFDVEFRTALEDRLYVRIGERGLMNMRIVFESRQGQVEIGDRVFFGGGSIICREKVTIGSDVTIAWGVTLYDHNSHALDWRQRAKVVKHFHDKHGK